VPPGPDGDVPRATQGDFPASPLMTPMAPRLLAATVRVGFGQMPPLPASRAPQDAVPPQDFMTQIVVPHTALHPPDRRENRADAFQVLNDR
jgi:hypothetical protein